MNSDIKDLQKGRRKGEGTANKLGYLIDSIKIIKWILGLAIFSGITIVSFASFPFIYAIAILALGSGSIYGLNKLSNAVEKKFIPEQNATINELFRNLREQEEQKGAVKRMGPTTLELAPTPKKTVAKDKDASQQQAKPKFNYEHNLIGMNVAEEPDSEKGPNIPSYLTGRR